MPSSSDSLRSDVVRALNGNTASRIALVDTAGGPAPTRPTFAVSIVDLACQSSTAATATESNIAAVKGRENAREMGRGSHVGVLR